MRKGFRESFETTKGRYSIYVDSLGRKYARLNGKFVARETYNRARSQARRRAPVKTLATAVDATDFAPRPPKSKSLVYQNAQGRWVAGADASDYFPRLKKGQFVSLEQKNRLRQLRTSQRNYFAFATREINEGRSIEEIEERYAYFVEAIQNATEEEKRELLKELWGSP